MIQKLKDINPLPIKLIAVIFVISLCLNLPTLFFWSVCLKQDIFRPPHTEILVSSCKRPAARGVADRKAVFVYERRTGKTYLLDLRTMEKRDVPNEPFLMDKGIFLTSDLVWLVGSYTRPESTGYRPHYILDLTDGKRYALLDLAWLPRLEDYEFDTKNYSYFQSVNQVFIHHSRNVVIALPSNFRENPEAGVLLSQYALFGGDSENGTVLEELMKDLGIDYEVIDLSMMYTSLPSPAGRYLASWDGIYLSDTNMPVISREYMGGNVLSSYFESWFYDESGVVIQGPSSFLYSNPLLGSYYVIPSPVLKLRLPGS